MNVDIVKIVRDRKRIEAELHEKWYSVIDAYKQYQEEKKRLLKPIEAAEREARQVVIEAVNRGESPPPGVQVVEEWAFEIKDLSEIPDSYKIPDEKKIREMVRMLGENTEIPGVRVYLRKNIRVYA